MAPRESFKIDKNDPDLQTFELYIAEWHPEFRALRQNGQPSYEHPDFCEKTLEFSGLPGSDDPYDLLALNLFSKDDFDKYINEALDEIIKPISKQKKIEYKFKELESALKTVKYSGIINDGYVTGEEELDYILSYSNSIIDIWLGDNLPTSKNLYENIVISSENLNEIKVKTNEVIDALNLLAEAEVINSFFNNKSEHHSKKYAVLSHLFFTKYISQLEDYVNSYFNDFINFGMGRIISYSRGSICNTGLPKSVRMYPALVLAYKLANSISSNFKSPSSFIFIERHGNYSASSFKISYRHLFIKAWLYSYLKDKDISQTKMAEIIALDNRFYPDEDLVIRDDFESKMENREDEYIIFQKRHKRLTNMFSKWKKSQNENGFISNEIFSKSKEGYLNVTK